VGWNICRHTFGSPYLMPDYGYQDAESFGNCIKCRVMPRLLLEVCFHRVHLGVEGEIVGHRYVIRYHASIQC
jgi:hypothetical protein